jgi:Glycosyltransferase
MKNLLFVTTSISYGGASKILCYIANSLSSRGYNVSIANIQTTGRKDSYNQIIREEITVYDVSSSVADGNFWGRRLSRIDIIRKLYKLSKTIHADIIIGFTVLPNFMSCIVGKMRRIPSIMSERGDPFRTYTTSVSDRLRKCIIENCTGGVFQTHGAMEFYNQKLQKKSVVIPNPIFLDTAPAISSPGSKTVVSLGRFDNYQKRYDVMISAFKEFSLAHPEFSLLLYGNGPDYDKIVKWCEETGVADKVKFCGVTKNSLEVLSNSSIYLITSDFEGISNSLLEAMAVGLACVSTDHSPGGARLLIQDHINGILAPCGDSHAIANALSEFADNAPLMESCGREAKKVIERFSPDKIVDMWEEYIGLLLNNNG